MFDIKIQKCYSEMILSVSGWRAVYDLDGKQGRSGSISTELAFLTFLACKTFEDFLLSNKASSVIIGQDSRPTGHLLVSLAEKTFQRVKIKQCGYVAAPEIMAHSKKSETPFIYFSASHNPIGYNGIKFGLKKGGVLDAKESETLITSYKLICENYINYGKENELVQAPKNSSGSLSREVLSQLEREFSLIWENIKSENHTCKNTNKINFEKEKSLEHYFDFAIETISGTDDKEKQITFCSQFKSAVSNYKKEHGDFCIVYDFNGSARAYSIDKRLFNFFDLNVNYFNEKEIAHEIIPEGENLKPVATKMAELAKSGKSPLFALMPDCDGDRGNLVFWDEAKKSPLVLNAQEVFALCVLSELSFIRFANLTKKPVAVVVNGATSLRIKKIAEAFDASVFTAEVGEANVVNLAAKLRNEGYYVRILGEGSNGGNITFPASVRDPMNTVFAILKLFLFRENDTCTSSPFKLWTKLSGQESLYKKDFTLNTLILSLPKYTSTETQMERALLEIKTKDAKLLKEKYQQVFLKSWEERKAKLAQKYGIAYYKVFGTIGTEEFSCEKDFAKSGSGGLKILFYASNNEAIAFIWMRGSKTEPVLRIMADIKGENPEAEIELVSWQGEMVKKADMH